MLDKFFKWFAPGLRIKRWIAVIFLGLIFAVCASLLLVSWFFVTKGMTRNLTFGGNELLIGAVLGFGLSAFCLITGIYRLMKSMWGLVDRRGARKGLVEA